ncbi:PEP-CTERM sorting domain-containing protein [Massilia sp. CT11-137]|uniref:PEP-CTERM sorting domain-containing protein n=1 Tax=Massilia sp. CT11-137 TaxID=3393901 RepID=UPI0039AF20EB
MKKTIIGLLATMACALAHATVIHFDDLPGDESLPIDAGYAGFNWDNMGTIRADAYPGSGFEAGVVSPANVAYNWFGQPATISKADGNAWAFTGAYFTSAWIDQEISFEGWRNGQLLVTSGAFTLDTTAPRWVELDWAGIDTLVIYNSSPTAWAMDEFTVPEPGSLALMGTSLLALMAGRRRKRAV